MIMSLIIKIIRIFPVFVLSGLTAVTLLSCYENPTSNPQGNQAPNTYLFLYPDSTISGQPSKLTVSWSGDDPDGLVIGYYFKWVGVDSGWSFTTGNDSTFTLPIGTADTTYDFLISAVDNGGNGVYDNQVIQNGINYGPEPFIDKNGNGKYDAGESYYDIGLIDPTPADLNFPIKNTAPEISWNPLTILPDTSFPVMTLAWDASDLDGDETIKNINIALNDTTNFVSLDGSTRLVTLRVVDFNVSNPEMQILINGSDQNIFSQTLHGLLLNDNNRIFIQATDLSGAKTNFVMLPDSSKTWYVKKPKGQLLIVDDYNNSTAAAFYRNAFNSINNGILSGKFDTYSFQASPLPFVNVTFPETIKLFKYLFWYSGSQPRIDLLSAMTNEYIQNSGKIMLSMTFQDSSASFSYDIPTLKSFLPIDSISYNKVSFLFSPTNIDPVAPFEDYPSLVTSATVGSVRLFYPSLTSQIVYEINGSQISGPIGIMSNDKNLFFIGIPLHFANGGEMNVNQLLEKVFFEEFGLVP
jgi:hypothetical protein